MDKIVVISGGSKGIGAATAQKFNIEGFKVFILDVVPPEMTIPSGIHYLNCDITDVKSIKLAIDKIITEEGHINVLVCNAGIHLSANIEETTEQDFHKVVDINLKGYFFLLKTVLPHMRQQQKGAVILLGSDQSMIAKSNSSIYGATKAAVGHLAKSTALDYAKYNIRVNCVCSGTIDTPLYRNAIAKYSKKAKIPLSAIEKEEALQQPLGRIGKPEEVAELVYFLGSAKACFITGALYAIDGGYTAQ